MASVYILFSKTLNEFYTGSCKDLQLRFLEHKNRKFSNCFTAQQTDWELFHSIDCLDYKQARKIEIHIKRMKSKTYIENLKKYPEMVEKLVLKYA